MRTIKQVAKYFGVQRQVVWYWINRGQIKAMKMGDASEKGIYVISDAEVERLKIIRDEKAEIARAKKIAKAAKKPKKIFRRRVIKWKQ